jgi:hypothetical protein
MSKDTEPLQIVKGIGSELDENRTVQVLVAECGDFILKFVNKNNVGNEEQMIRLSDEAARAVADSIRCLVLDISAEEWNERSGL